MNSEELKRGNLLQLMSEPNPVIIPTGFVKQVDEIRASNVSMYFIDKPIHEQQLPMQHNLNRLCGIPLTEDWALRFRFKEEAIGFCRAGVTLYFKDGIITVYYATQWISSVKIKYVHELQNFMYSFGEELIIKNER
jgi:hypothetical protein